MPCRNVLHWLATNSHPWAARARQTRRKCLGFTLPAPRLIVRPVLYAFVVARSLYYTVFRLLICEPMFKAYCTDYGRGVRTGVFIHWIHGQGQLRVGNNVAMDGKSSIQFAARYAAPPQLIIGDDTFVGHNCTFVIGKSIHIGRGCLLSTDVALRDFDGHPLDPVDRAAGLPAASNEVRPIVIGDNVWIGSRAIVLKGVTIGDNSIVATGAIVTRDVPPNVVVAGNPARVVKSLTVPFRDKPQAASLLQAIGEGTP